MKVLLRRTLATLLGSVTMLAASAAFAEGEACYNDDDCPNPACGGDVCNWAKSAAKPDGRKFFYCQAAGQEPKGTDGWCESDANCKCKGSGATCNTKVSHCTDTGTPAASTGGSSAGGSAAAGAPATAGTAAGGAPATAGAPTSSAGTGTAPATPASSDSGGCSVSAPGNAGGAALLLAAVGVGFAFARRRR